MHNEGFKHKRVSYQIEPGRVVNVKMTPIIVDIKGATLVCDKCSYKPVCLEVNNPVKIGEEKLSNLCQSLSEKLGKESDDLGDSKIITYIPMPGAFEEEFPELRNLLGELLESKVQFEVTDIIDKVCSGWCDYYNPDYTNCNGSNQICILKKLFNGDSKRENIEE